MVVREDEKPLLLFDTPLVVSFVTMNSKDTKSVQIRSFPIALWKRGKVSAAEMGVGLSAFVIESASRRLGELKHNNHKGEKHK